MKKHLRLNKNAALRCARPESGKSKTIRLYCKARKEISQC